MVVATANFPLCPCPAGWLLNLQHLTLGDRIGQGEFGGRWEDGMGGSLAKGFPR